MSARHAQGAVGIIPMILCTAPRTRPCSVTVFFGLAVPVDATACAVQAGAGVLRGAPGTRPIRVVLHGASLQTVQVLTQRRDRLEPLSGVQLGRLGPFHVSSSSDMSWESY